MSGNHPDVVAPMAIHGRQPECLTDIFREEVNLAVWQRKLPDECHQFAQEFSSHAGRFERFIGLGPDDGLEQILPEWAMELQGAGVWLSDVREMIDMFRCLFEPAAVGVRLHVLPGTMCPRFHTDRVPARLLVTYAGKGTEWLPEKSIERPDGPGPLPDQQVPRSEIQTIATGAVALLKGEAWIGNEGRGVVHRSPDPEGRTRLVLGLDWLS